MTQPFTSLPPNNLRVCLGSALFFLGLVVTTVLIAPVIILLAVFPFSVRYRAAKLWAGTVLKLAEACCGIRYEVEGLEHVPAGKAVIVLSNHQSAWETIAFRYILPPQTSLFKRSLLWLPFWGWAMATLKPIPIDRGNKAAALRKLINQGTQALKEGLWVVVFPEGTRRPVGELGNFGAGGAMLAQKSAYPVLPIAHNAGAFWPRYSFLKYPGTIKVKIGAPIESEGRKAAEINKQAEDWIRGAMQEIYSE